MKDEKQVKCKKCKLTYSKKKYTCPYCHKKRFNPKPILFTVAAVALLFMAIQSDAISAVGYAFGSVDGMKVKITGTEEISRSSIIFPKNIKINIEFKNNGNSEKALKYDLQCYVDGYLIDESFGCIDEKLAPDMKYTYGYEVNLENLEWKKIVIYYRPETGQGDFLDMLVQSDGGEAEPYKKLADYKN